MTFNTKCLWTLTLTIYLGSFSNKLCFCKSTYAVLEDKHNAYDGIPEDSHNEMSRSDMIDDEIAKIATAEQPGWGDNVAHWSKGFFGDTPENKGETDMSIAQVSPNKRKWSKFVSWGKRDHPTLNDFDSERREFNDKREIEVLKEPLNIDQPLLPKQLDDTQSAEKRKWHGLVSWGKRNLLEYQPNDVDVDKRKWHFTSWGKRDNDLNMNEMDKRKWAKFTSWGKRGDDSLLDDLDKRARWAKFTSWGKRADNSLLDELEKRAKWAKFTSWGKRSELNNDIEAAKRKWAKFTSWGKREDGVDKLTDEGTWSIPTTSSYSKDDEIETMDKRNWSKFTSWGKRPRNPRAWLALNTWGKRRWSGLTTWGKRSGTGYQVESVARKLLHFFDSNGDGALDLEELYAYIRTLMSLPSKEETETPIPVQDN